MYLMYVDESGDTGGTNSPTRYFVLSGLVIHELHWKQFLDDLIAFRRILRNSKGLKLREEIHASDFVNKPGALSRIKRNDRIDILKKCIDWCAARNNISIINVRVDKQNTTVDVFEKAWNVLLQRFENTMSNRNFPGPANPDERGLVIPDNTDNKKLQMLVRKMRRFNPIPHNRSFSIGGSRNLTINYIVEDPFLKNSRESFIHQMVDIIAYCLMQRYAPNNYMRKKGGHKFLNRLIPVLCTHASRSHPMGIVEI